MQNHATVSRNGWSTLARFRRLVLTVVVASVGVGTGRRDTQSPDTAATLARSPTHVDLTGAGATFPYPLYARWFNEYAQVRGIRINYQSIGSGSGIRKLLAGEVDFGATDVPMTDSELARAPSPIHHVPMVVGAVAITYNLPGLTHPLNLTSDVIADVFLGRITRWNDARIAASNPEAVLPSQQIAVVHRTDASGTSWIFSGYLAAVSERWRTQVGAGRDIKWPVGAGGEGNEGVAGHVKQTIGAIGYLEVVYARQNRLPTVHVQNKAGRFVSPLPYEVASAAAAVLDSVDAGHDLRISLVNPPGAQSYPIASFTWLLLSPAKLGVERTRMLLDFIRWALSDGDQLAGTMGYVALPQETTRRVLARLAEIDRSN